MHALQHLGTQEVLGRAAYWCELEDPLKRARGADILAQLGKTAEHPANNFANESFVIVSRLLNKEREVRPLAAAIYALGHIGNSSAVPLICPYRSHSDKDVRFAIAFALGCFPNDPEAVETLLELMRDADEEIRDWAIFGLGVLGDDDAAEIRDALISRLADTDKNVREEAVVALSKRKEVRVLPTLIEMLNQSEPPNRAIEAASWMLEREEADWTGCEYVVALREQFRT